MQEWTEPDAARVAEDVLRGVRIRQRALGVLFRHRWSDISRAPLPDDWLALLEKARQREPERDVHDREV